MGEGWRAQGRQEHGWFGHGTDGAAPREPLADRLSGLQASIKDLKGRIANATVELQRGRLPAIGSEVKAAAAGDLQCEGFSGGCQIGGSYGTTAAFRVTGSNLCRSCAVKMLGVGNEPGSVQTKALRPFLLESE